MSEQGAESIRLMCPLFQAGEGGETPTSALQLRFYAIDLPHAQRLNRLWHSRLPHAGRPACRVAYAADFGGSIYRGAGWTATVASEGGKGWSNSRGDSRPEQSTAPKQRWEKVIRTEAAEQKKVLTRDEQQDARER